jgi:hypothetical protein
VEPDTSHTDARSALLPLGALWAGVCRAGAAESGPPEEASVRRLCQLGYARDNCFRFPANDAGADAVRFTISRDDGQLLLLHYVLERDHHPYAHGSLEYQRGSERLVRAPQNEIVRRQAEAYITSYLRQKEQRAGSR